MINCLKLDKYREVNQIVSIERIQNREIYELCNVKRGAMMKKHDRNFPSKEKMLFHGTSFKNLDKISADGLNRSYALGAHGKIRGGPLPSHLFIYFVMISFMIPL